MLKYIYLPSKIKTIAENAFYFSGVAELKLPESLEIIGDSAFYVCKNLEYVEIPKNVKSIGSHAFKSCSRLKILVIKNNPEYIGDHIVSENTLIRCYKGSVVDQYCQKSNLNMEYL